MCFSAEASFGASIVITTVGAIAYKKSGQTPLRYIAMIPILFGIQQFSEGFVWLSNSHEQLSGLKNISTNTFIFFAWIIWPIYIPFAFRKVEVDPKKKKVLLFLVLIGLLIAGTLTYLMVFMGVNSKIQDCSILYDFTAPHSFSWLFAIFYVSSVVLPTVISSLSKAWWLGVANISLYFVTKMYVNERVISVWCFFAAFTSILILWLIVLEKKRIEKTNLDKT